MVDEIKNYGEILDKLLGHDKVKNSSVLFNKITHMRNGLSNLEQQQTSIKASQEVLNRKLEHFTSNLKGMLASKELQGIDIGL